MIDSRFIKQAVCLGLGLLWLIGATLLFISYKLKLIGLTLEKMI